MESPALSPFEQAIGREAVEAYEQALGRLKPDDREAIIGAGGDGLHV